MAYSLVLEPGSALDPQYAFRSDQPRPAPSCARRAHREPPPLPPRASGHWANCQVIARQDGIVGAAHSASRAKKLNKNGRSLQPNASAFGAEEDSSASNSACAERASSASPAWNHAVSGDDGGGGPREHQVVCQPGALLLRHRVQERDQVGGAHQPLQAGALQEMVEARLQPLLRLAVFVDVGPDELGLHRLYV